MQFGSRASEAPCMFDIHLGCLPPNLGINHYVVRVYMYVCVKDNRKKKKKGRKTMTFILKRVVHL